MADISVLQAQKGVIRANMTKLNVYAPYSGKLGLKQVSPGAFVTPASVITTISQVNQLKLQFNIPEKYSAMVKKGQSIDFTIDGVNKNFSATVLATEDAVEAETRSLAVRALITGTDPELVPGAFAKVKMVLGEDKEALLIPNESVTPQGRKKIIYLAKDGKAVATEITTGERNAANIQVLSGVQKGDTLITTGLLFLKPNAPITITKMNAADTSQNK